MDREPVYENGIIYKTNHLLTYGGGPEGGYVYFYKEKDPGWYRWHQTWFQPPTHTKIFTGQVATKFQEKCEYIGALPDNGSTGLLGEESLINFKIKRRSAYKRLDHFKEFFVNPKGMKGRTFRKKWSKSFCKKKKHKTRSGNDNPKRRQAKPSKA